MQRLAAAALVLLLLPTTPAAVLPVARETAWATVSRYDLSVRVLPESRRIEVAGTWELPATDAERPLIEFYLSPKMGGLRVELVEPLASAPLNLQGSREENGDVKWTFQPAQPVPAGRAVRLRFSYASDGKPAPQFNVSREGSFAGGGGELWYPQTAFKNREVGTLTFSVPAGETVVSNGAPQGTAAQRARGDFAFRVTRPSKFGFACGRYTVLRRAGKVNFNLYLLRPRAQARAVLDNSARALDFLTSLFGAFPYSEFSLVEVNFPTIVVGTSEFGFILADDSKLDQQFDLSYWAHEMGHQWWGDEIRTAAGTAGQMLLSEGVAQFGALLAVEAVEGGAAAEQFRREGYHGKGQSAAAYFRLVQSGADFPLAAYVPRNPDETLRMHRLVNTKGFVLLDMLSREIGRDRFASIMRRFVRQKSNGTTSWQEFQQAVEAGAGRDVRWFFRQWFERAGAPDYELTWKQEGSRVRGLISQPEPNFRATLEVEFGGGGRRLLKTVEVTSRRTEFDWAAPFRVESAVLDPHYKVLRWTPELRGQ